MHELIVISTNIGRIREVEWRGRKIFTGIFKVPVDEPLFLGKMGVNKDEVADLKVHGVSDKAGYIYGSDQYAYFKTRFPDVDWKWGIFGENLTIEGLDESRIRIGDIYSLGSATVQVSQPRLPCYKLGIRFGTPRIIKTFLESPYPGVYVRVLEEGHVTRGDAMVLTKPHPQGMSVAEVYSLFSSNKNDTGLRSLACEQEYLAESLKKDLR